MALAYDLVYVFRDDTYDFEQTAEAKALELLSLLLEAKTREVIPNPELPLLFVQDLQRAGQADFAVDEALRLYSE